MDAQTPVLVAPIANQAQENVFIAPPGPRFPCLFRMRDSVPGPALTISQLDEFAELLTLETMTHPFILSVGGDTPTGELYVFFRAPNDPRKGKRNVYQWVKAPNADEARLLLDHAPRPARNKSEGSKSNA